MYELSAHYHHSYKRFTTKDGSTMKWENDGMTFDKQECLDNDQKIHDDFNLELLPRLKMIFDRHGALSSLEAPLLG
jgi:hypothetical protein